MINPVKIVPSHKTEGWHLTTHNKFPSKSKSVLPVSGRQVTPKIYVLTFIQLTIIAVLAIINQKIFSLFLAVIMKMIAVMRKVMIMMIRMTLGPVYQMLR